MIRSPRLTSISRSRVRVTDCPASAAGRSPSKVTIRVTVAVAPDGSTRTSSPGRTVPPAMIPA